MKANDTRDFIQALAISGLHVPVALVGPMGIGKSQIVRQAACEARVGFIDLRLSLMEPGDLIGLPARENGRTKWLAPEWFPEPGTRGILLLEEPNRSALDVRQAIFQLLTEWRLHTHVLPDGWVIIAAMNPDDGVYQVEALDIAMLRRFLQIKVTPTVEEWLQWARGRSIDPRLIGFVRAHPKMLALADASTIAARPTPDGYRMLDVLLGSGIVPPHLLHEVATGVLGLEAGTALCAYLERAPSATAVGGEDVLAHYPLCREVLRRQRNDERAATLESLVTALGARPQGLDPTELGNLGAYLDELDDEWKIGFLHKIGHLRAVMQALSRSPGLNRAILRILNDASGPKGSTALAQPPRRP